MEIPLVYYCQLYVASAAGHLEISILTKYSNTVQLQIVLQGITAILSLKELIEDDLNKTTNDHNLNVESYFLVITVISWLSTILLILQIDVSWTIQSMINLDLDTQYRRASLSSSRVSI